MKDRYFYALSDCLARRKEWVRDVEIFLDLENLEKKPKKKHLKTILIIYLIYKIINLPTNFLNFLSKIRQYSDYNKTLAEIEIIRQEMSKYNNKHQITNRSENNAEK